MRHAAPAGVELRYVPEVFGAAAAGCSLPAPIPSLPLQFCFTWSYCAAISSSQPTSSRAAKTAAQGAFGQGLGARRANDPEVEDRLQQLSLAAGERGPH